MQWLRVLSLLVLCLGVDGVAVSPDRVFRQSQRRPSGGQSFEQNAIFPLPGADEEQRTMDAISQFRAQICADMKDEHGVKFESYEACRLFMEDACKPGRDGQMDGDGKEITSGHGYCTEYFPEAVKKAKKKITDEDAKNYAVSPGPMPMPAPAPAPAPKMEAPAPAQAATGSAPAPGPAGAPGPGPGPAPAPFIPGVSAGKPYGPIAKDEKYYYKDGGKDKNRFHMDEKQKLPTQGYWGKLVEHEDMETATGDWGKEFGTKDATASFHEFCDKHPDNPWCEKNHQRHSKGFSLALSSFLLLGLLVNAAL